MERLRLLMRMEQPLQHQVSQADRVVKEYKVQQEQQDQPEVMVQTELMVMELPQQQIMATEHIR